MLPTDEARRVRPGRMPGAAMLVVTVVAPGSMGSVMVVMVVPIMMMVVVVPVSAGFCAGGE